MNNEILKYREKEISYNLDVIAQTKSDKRSIGLISRYLIIKKRIKQGGDSEDSYIAESKLQAILSSISKTDFSDNEKTEPGKGISPLQKLSRLYLRGIRYILGKDMPEEVFRDYNDPLIELAYFYERYRRYDKALEVMESIRKRRRNLARITRRTILLHSGFCYAMLTQYSKARNSYKSVMEYYPKTDEAKTAKILLGFLSTMQRGTKSLIAKNIPGDKKAFRMFLLSAYGSAKRLYGEFFKSAKLNIGKNRFYKAKFYNSRSTEELGNQKQAIKGYKNIIAKVPGTLWAKKSNQRLLLLGKFYKGNKKLVVVARRNVVRLGDSDFLKAIENIEKTMVEDRFNVERGVKSYNYFVKRTKVKRIDVFEDKEAVIIASKTKSERDIFTDNIKKKNSENILKKEDIIKKTEPVKKEDVIKKTEPVKQEDIVKKTEPVKKEDVVKKTEPVKKEDVVKKTEPVKKEDVVKKTEPVKKEDVVKKTEPVKKGDVVKKIEPDKKKRFFVRIVSKDGFFFEGEMIGEDKKEMLIKTEFGNMPVKKDMIKSIKRYKMKSD
ncbi:tetratricopeptide repeat protein [Spirochaetota bacterium]